MTEYKQAQMFTHGEDLPLFSGTAQHARADTFRQEDVARQEPMAECSTCLDTGGVGKGKEWRYCTCAAGARLREQHRIERQAERRAEWNAGIR